MSARSLAVTGAVVVGAAFAFSQLAIEARTDRDLTLIIPFQGVQEQEPDSTYLERLAEALKNANTPRDSARMEAYRRALAHMQDSGRVNLRHFLPALECPMPVATDSTSLPMPTRRSTTKHTMPVLRSSCWNPLFAGVKPDSQ